MNWMEIIVQSSHAATETVADIFHESGCGGVVIEDPRLLNFYINSGLWDYTDLKEVEDTGFSIVKAYLPVDEKLKAALAGIERELAMLEKRVPASLLGEIYFRQIDEEDWSSAWKQYFHPVRIGRSIIIKPTWEDYQALAGDLVIELDPGMAFGTGTHNTTCLCVESLEQLVRPGMMVFDVGTGSGILSLVSAKLGAQKVVAVDFDAVAVRVAKENVVLNDLTQKVTVHEGDLLSVVAGEADVIVANIIASIICQLLPDIPSKLSAGGVFLASGIIVERLDEVCAKAKEVGLVVDEVKEKDGWALVVMRKGREDA